MSSAVTNHHALSLPPEADPLARELARAFREKVEFYKRYFKLSHQDAVDKVSEVPSAEEIAGVMSSPPEEVTWSDLERLNEHEPDAFWQRWEGMKKAALEHAQTGYRAALIQENASSTPWKRALLAATYTELVDGWQPRNGAERQLVEIMAIAFSQLRFWLEQLCQRASPDSYCERDDRSNSGVWMPPRVTEKEAQDQAGEMFDRFNKVYLRTVRALRDLRRYPSPIIVQNAGQVNVGGQQVNVSGLERSNGGGG
jgi:hypothetical protein